MKPRVAVSSRAGLLRLPSRAPLWLGCSLIASLATAPAQTNGRWIGATTNAAPAANYTNAANWESGNLANGADATATYVFNPITDNGTAGTALAGGSIFDAPRTLGYMIFEDTAGFGGATIGLNNPTAVSTLTLSTTAAGTVPALLGGQVLNSQSNGKKVVINPPLAGSQGLLRLGPGYISLRGPTASNTISGNFASEGGVLAVRTQYNFVTGVVARHGGAVELEFAGAGVGTVNRVPTGASLTLGGPDGGGVVYNTAAAAPTLHSQTFSGVTLGGGVNEIRAVIGGTAPNFQDMTYNLGTVTQGPHATLNLARSAATGTGNFLLSNSNGSNGIIGAWMTFNGGNWAVSSGGLAAAFAAYTANNWGPGVNTNVTASAARNNVSTGTLRFDTGNAVKITLTGTNIIETGGIISQQQAPVITGGTLTSGTTDLYLHTGGAGTTGLLIESVIADGTAGPLHLSKALNGITTFAADNTYTGGTSLGAGTLVLGAPVFGGGSTGSIQGPIFLSNLSTTGGAFSSSGFLAFNRSGTYTLTNPINPTVNAGGLLEQWSTGSLVINKAVKTGGLRAYAGTIVLDFNAAGAPASDLVDGNFTAGGVTLPTARLTARNGNLNLLGKDGAASEQRFALTDSFGASTLSVQPGVGGTAVLALGALNRNVNSNDGGGIFVLNAATGGRFTTTESGVSGTNPLLAIPFNIPYVVVGGNDWAARATASSDIVAGSTLAGFYTPTSSVIPNTNADYDAPTTLSGDTTYASLRFNTSGGTLTADAGLQPNGILVTPAAGGTTTIAGGGFLRAAGGGGTSTATTARDIVIAQNNPAGKLLISVPVNNFDSNNRTELTKAGPGELELGGVSNYTGRTFVNRGIIRITGGAGIGNTTTRAGSLLMRGGEMVVQDNSLFATGGFCSVGQRVGDDSTLTVKDSAIFDIAADFNVGDVNAKGTLNVRDNASVLTRSWFIGKGGFAIGTVNQTGGTITASNTPAGEWNLGGNTAGDPMARGVFNLSGGLFNTVNQNYQTGRYGKGIMNLTGGTIQGTGFHVVGRHSSGEGTVNISGGLYDAVPLGVGAQIFIVGETGRGTVNVSGSGTLKAKNVSLGHNGGSGVVNQTGGTVETTDVAAINGTVPGGLVFAFTPAPGLVLPDYSGTYNLRGGILRTFGMGENTAATTPYSSSFRFDGGTLQATASNGAFIQNVDSVIVEDGGALIDSNGFDLTVITPLTHDATLGATPDGGLTKSGLGSLILGGTNTYTGDTRVSGGLLSLTNIALDDASDVRLSTGGTLDPTFSGSDTIDQFFIDGTAQPAGTWGSLASTATNKTARITGTGILNVTTGPAAASGYAAWAALPVNGLTASVTDDPTRDPDSDGIANLTEFILDGNPSILNTAVLPVTTVKPTTVTVAFKRRDDSESGNTLLVQHSTDLALWTDILVGPVSGGAVSVSENGAGPDDILVTVPRGSAVRLYARLKITPNL